MRRAAVFVMLAALVPAISFAAESRQPRSKRLEVTAVGLEWLAKKKRKLINTEADPEKKKRLLAELGEIERLTDETFRKAKEEAIFEESPDVLHARLDEEKASAEVQKAQDAVDAAKEVLQNPPETSQKARIRAAEDFMKRMQELEARKKTLESARQAREAAEHKAKEMASSKKP